MKLRKFQWLCLSLALSLCFGITAQVATPEPTPPLPPPAGATSPIRDLCANFWTLAPVAGTQRELLVLPVQAPTAWVPAKVTGAGPDEWQAVQATHDGFIWLSKPGRTVRFDPRKPQAGAVEAALPVQAPPSPWREVARMPASNHDLTAAVLNGRFFVAGGLTADWGFPARSHPFAELWELNPQGWRWQVAARLARERIYCATAAFDGHIWVIGGDFIEPYGKRYEVTTVERYNPRTKAVTPGPAPQFARPMPLALVGNGRLYVLGNPRGAYEKPGLLESIGAGETQWRREPDGPVGMGPLAGTALDGKLYVVIPKTGIAAFDTATRRWEMLASPTIPRSCQMAAYRGELWLMGGRDIENLSQTQIYNPRTRAWRNGPSLPKPLSWGAAEVVNGQLIVTGGAAERSASDRTWIYNDRTYVLTETKSR